MQRVSTEVSVFNGGDIDQTLSSSSSSFFLFLIRLSHINWILTSFQGYPRDDQLNSRTYKNYTHMSDPQQTQIYNIQKPTTGTTGQIYVTLHKQAIGQPITLDIGDFYFCIRVNPLLGAFR